MRYGKGEPGRRDMGLISIAPHQDLLETESDKVDEEDDDDER